MPRSPPERTSGRSRWKSRNISAVHWPRPRTATISSIASSSASSSSRSSSSSPLSTWRGEVADVLDLAAGEPGAAQVLLARLQQLLRARGWCRRRGRARAGRSSAPLWSRAAGRRSPAAAPRRRRRGAPRCAAAAASPGRSCRPARSAPPSSGRRRRALCAPWRSPPGPLRAGASRRRRGCPRGGPRRRSRTRAGRSARPPAARSARAGVEQVDRAACCRASRAARWRRSPPPARPTRPRAPRRRPLR